jgi:tetratricopeptide (TPR) repeat protein
MFIESAMLAGVRCNDWPGDPIQAASDEAGWRSDIYYFMNYDNCNNVNSVCGANPTSVSNKTIGNGTTNYPLASANKFYLAGSYEQAAESYAKAVNLDPSLSEGWLNLGNSLYYLGKYQASLNAYNALLKLEPQNVGALAGKSLALLALNKTSGSNISAITPSTVQGP